MTEFKKNAFEGDFSTHEIMLIFLERGTKFSTTDNNQHTALDVRTACDRTVWQ